MKVLTSVDNSNIPDVIQPVTAKWAEAVQETIEFLQTSPNASEEDMQALFDIVLQSAAAVFAPAQFDRAGRKHVEKLFAAQLLGMGEQFKADKARYEETGAGLQ